MTLGLLQHDFGQPNAVGIVRVLPATQSYVRVATATRPVAAPMSRFDSLVFAPAFGFWHFGQKWVAPLRLRCARSAFCNARGTDRSGHERNPFEITAGSVAIDKIFERAATLRARANNGKDLLKPVRVIACG